MAELVPPFFEDDFVFVDFFTGPQVIVGVVEANIRRSSPGEVVTRLFGRRACRGGGLLEIEVDNLYYF